MKKGLQVPAAENMMTKFLENPDERAKNMKVAEDTMREAGTDQAADSQNAAFQKKK